MTEEKPKAPRLGRHNLHTQELFDKIRERLKVTEKECSNKTLREYFKYLNSFLIHYILDNPEGYVFDLATRMNGVLAISKHLPKEMREDKYQTLENIQNNPRIPEYLRKIYLKRYAVALDRRVKYESLKTSNPQYHANAHSFFYSYRFMWFNHRNCKIKKTQAYQFGLANEYRKELEAKIREGQDYNEYNFNDFYRFRIKPVQ